MSTTETGSGFTAEQMNAIKEAIRETLSEAGVGADSNPIKKIKAANTAQGRIVRNHVIWATATGFLPWPLIDQAALITVQYRMVHKLSKTYGEDIQEGPARKIIYSLISTILPKTLGRSAIGGLIKGIPFVGGILGAVTVPAFAGATTYALGALFNQHYASGGTFLTFDPDAVKAHYTKLVQEELAASDN